MALDPEVDMAAHLQAAGIGTLRTDLFTGPLRPVSTAVPVNSIFVQTTGGPPPQRVMELPAGIRNASVQVRIRRQGSDYSGGLAKARAVVSALDGRRPSGYVDVVPFQSEPVFIGIDDNSNYHWSVNFSARYGA